MEKGLIPGLGQEIYKISLEHLVVPENKEVYQKTKTKSKPTLLEVYQRGTAVNQKAPNGKSWNNLSNKIK